MDGITDENTGKMLGTIGPTLAVVGTLGWRCCVCDKIFPRSFSIDHHMIMSHHPPPEKLQSPLILETGSMTDSHTIPASKITIMEQEGADDLTSSARSTVHSCDHEKDAHSFQDEHFMGKELTSIVKCNDVSKENKTPEERTMGGAGQPLCFAGNSQTQHITHAFRKEEHILDSILATSALCPAETMVSCLARPAPWDNPATQSQHSPDSPQSKIPRYQMNTSAPDPAVNSAGTPVDTTAFMDVPQKRRKPTKYWICSCREMFESKLDFKTHRRFAHCRLNQKVFICPICKVQYLHKRGLNQHMATKGLVPVTCVTCQEIFHDKSSLEEHIVLCHKGTASSVAQTAAEKALYNSTLGLNKPQDDWFKNSSNVQWPSDKWECSKCKQKFDQKDVFRMHLIECKILRFEEGGKRVFYCSVCPENFSQLVQYHSHYVSAHKLGWMSVKSSTPASASLPLIGLSPAVSPCPSMTSEINSAMASVDLDKKSVVGGGDMPSLSSSSGRIDLTNSDNSIIDVDDDDRQSLTSSASNSQSFLSESVSWDDRGVITLSDDDSEKDDDDEDTSSSDNDWEVIDDNKTAKPEGQGKNSKKAEHNFYPLLYAGLPPPPPPPPPPPHPSFFQHPQLCRMHGCDSSPYHPFHHHPFHHPFDFHHHFPHHGPYGRGRHCRQRGRARMLMKLAAMGAWNLCQNLGSGKGSAQPDAATETAGTVPGAAEGPAGNTAGTSKHFPWTEQRYKGKVVKKMMKLAFLKIFKNCQLGNASYVCPSCLQVFQEDTALDRHNLEAHSDSVQQYFCPLCIKFFTSPVAYNQDIRQHAVTHGSRGKDWLHTVCKLFKHGPFGKHGMFGKHDTSPWFDAHTGDSQASSNTTQSSFFDDQGSGDNHSTSVDKVQCPVCQKTFRADSRSNYFERHVNSHFGVDVHNFKCLVEECGKTFLEKSKFTAHMASHNSPGLYVCEQCGKSYQNKTSLTRHERIHTGERPYKCEQCGEGFIENRDLVRHRSVHTGEAAFKCEICLRGFTLKASLLTHMRNKHNIGVLPKPLACSGCQEDFLTAVQLCRHQETCPMAQKDREEASNIRIKTEPAVCMDLDSND